MSASETVAGHVEEAAAPTTRAFAPFEWLVALRYLRARRKEGFISVIAGFSFIGIMLGVATLIIVMAVMNGFRQELFDKMLGLNGHVVVHSVNRFTDYDEVAKRVRGVPGDGYELRGSTVREAGSPSAASFPDADFAPAKRS